MNCDQQLKTVNMNMIAGTTLSWLITIEDRDTGEEINLDPYDKYLTLSSSPDESIALQKSLTSNIGTIIVQIDNEESAALLAEGSNSVRCTGTVSVIRNGETEVIEYINLTIKKGAIPSV